MANWETRVSNESELLTLSGLTNGSLSSSKLELRVFSRKFVFTDLEASKKRHETRRKEK